MNRKKYFYICEDCGEAILQRLDVIKNLDNDSERVLIVGHNPILVNLINKLISMDGETRVKFPTAGLVLITCNIDNWKELKEDSNELKLLLYPKLFKKSLV